MPEILNAEKAQENVNQVNGDFGALDSSGQIDLPAFDNSKFIGKESKIAIVEERQGKWGFYIKILSLPVDDGDRPIRASRMFSLQKDKDGKIGWSENSKLGVFLQKHNVKHYKELVGSPSQIEVLKDEAGLAYRVITGNPSVNVIIQTRAAKDGYEYLTF